MPSSSQKFWNSAAVKFVPLSVMMLCGTPNLKIIDLIKFTAVRAVELVIGTASIHLVNLSTATSRCVLPPFDDFLRGPTISSTHVAKGHDNGVICVPHGGRPAEYCPKGFFHEFSTSCMMPAGVFVDLE